MEKTLVIIKPDTIQRSLIGEIINRFEKAGLKIVGVKMLLPAEPHYHHHYETISKMISRRGEDKFKANLEFMMTGPVIAMVLEGIEAVNLVRKLVGDTEPKSALPGTIRGDYAHMSYSHADSHGVGIPNLVHASGETKEAKAEIEHWFKPGELFDYPLSHGHFTLTNKKSTAKK